MAQAVSTWLHALAECPNNAEVFYRCCKFLMAQVRSDVTRQSLHLELQVCVMSACKRLPLISSVTGEVERHCSSVQRLHPVSV